MILTATGLSYLFLLGMIIIGLHKLRKTKPVDNNYQPSVTIVIAARDEEENLPATLQSLTWQNYPDELLEIIVVDDRSSDRTAETVKEFNARYSFVKLIRQTETIPGASPKKQALEKGIKAARGEIIMTTDADCTHDRNWVQIMVDGFTPEVGMVIGQARFAPPFIPPPVTGGGVRGGVLWQRLQALDFQALGYASAGLIAAGMPFHCSGASLAFRKQLFDDIQGWKGYDKLISGDDELLMAKAVKSRWKIVAATSPASIVKARPVSTLKELWHQRIRWGSKGLYYRFSRKFVLSGVFLFLLTLLIGPFIVITTGSWIYWIEWILFRFLLDWTAVKDGSQVFGEKLPFAEFLLTEIIYPPAIVVFTVAGHFTSFRWKDQRFRSRGKAR